MLYSNDAVQYINARNDGELLNASIELSKKDATSGWRVSQIQWATPGMAEYACYFSDCSNFGYDWGDEPWDERLWLVVIIDCNGERTYQWDFQAKQFNLVTNNNIETVKEAVED